MKTYVDLPYVENGTDMQMLDLYLPDGGNPADVRLTAANPVMKTDSFWW